MPRVRRVSLSQLEMLVAWMEGHPLQARATQLGVLQAKQLNLWDTLASTLNAVGDGVTKSPKEWRHYWSDQKNKAKRKVAALKNYGSGTDGGPAWGDVLTPIEERILSLMGVENVVGMRNVQIKLDVGLDDSQQQTSPPLSPPPQSPSPPPESPSPPPYYAVHQYFANPLPSGSCIARPPKRQHSATRTSADADDPLVEKSRPHTAAPRWALELEERRIQEEEARGRLEERRVEIEERRLAMEERRLVMEERRLAMEERRLAIEERRLAMEERRLATKEQRLKEERT